MSKKTARLLLALLATLALTLAACSGPAEDEPAGDESAPAETSEPATSEATSEEAAEATGQGDGVLTVGTVLPQTGSLASLGPPEEAGAALAVEEINEAGGVLDGDVELLTGDSGDTTTDIANQTVDQHMANGADVIVGAASSGVSMTFIDKVTGAGLVHFSPANTSPDFTEYPDNGLYFRTAPSDVLQGRILGELVIDDGATSVALLALQDPYGEGLLNNVSQTVQESGGEVTDEIVYDPQAQNFDAEVQQLVDSDPDAIVVIGFAESARLFSTLVEQGLGPQEKALYCVDGNVDSAELAEISSEIEGTRCTLPGANAEGDFRERLIEAAGGSLDSFSYGAETYDAIITTALAAAVAESDTGEDIAAELPGVTREGTKCTTYQECADLIESGEDIDYDGASGPIELDDVGDPQVANFQIREYTGDEFTELVEMREASMPGGGEGGEAVCVAVPLTGRRARPARAARRVS
jgi:ABC-type branched-subunit amino acid transport system substrate-binding protein